MKKSYILLLFFTGILQAQLDSLWTKSYGDTLSDGGYFIQQTNDGGYIAAGRVEYYYDNDNHFDGFLIKTDSYGDTLWTKSFGGIQDERAYSVKQTYDGGYIVLGRTNQHFSNDFWLVKTDELGDSLWTKTFGGESSDIGRSVIQDDDGGYLLFGYTLSYGNGSSDFWLIKIDSNGDSLWSKTYGGNQYEFGYYFDKTNDNGLILVGTTSSYGNGGTQYGTDIWIVKTNEDGDSLWSKTYGTGSDEYCQYINEDSDGNFIIIANTESFDNGDDNIWLLKTNANGDSLWSKTYGGINNDYSSAVFEIDNGGYLIIGSTRSFDNGEDCENPPCSDVWLIGVDANGDSLWSKTFGGAGAEYPYHAVKTNDDGYILVGGNQSSLFDNQDLWLIKLWNKPKLIITEIMQNPSGVSDAYGEWFELYNTGEDTIDISGWVFKDTDDDYLSLDVDCCLNIPPNRHYLMICNGDSAINGGISNYDFIYEREAFNLGNSDDEIIVLHSDGLEIDRVEYDGGATFPDPNGKSMELVHYDLDNNDGSNWVESANILPSGDYGTPGEANSTLVPELYFQIDTECTNWPHSGIHFGPVELGDTTQCSLYIENQGSGDLSISVITNDGFGVNNDSITVPEQDNDSLIIYFVPDTAGFYESIIELYTNDENNANIEVELYGLGLSPLREIYLFIDSLDFGEVAVGDSAINYIPIMNIGNTELEIDDIITDAPFYVDIDDGSLDPVEEVSVQVTFVPEDIGEYSGIVTIYSNDSDEEEVTVQLSGTAVTLAVDEIIIPKKFAVHQNHPNPFNPVTSIQYELPKDSFVNIRVYDLKGRLVNKLVSKEQTAGYKAIKWAGVDNKGRPVSAGIYLYEIQAGDFRQVRKMVLLK
jgi:hypothetical protein